MSIKKTELDKIQGLDENTRADLFALFESVEQKDAEIAALRQKAEDSDKVVAKSKDLEKLVAQRDAEKQDLLSRLDKLTGRAPGSTDEIELSAFKPFFDIFPEGSGDGDE